MDVQSSQRSPATPIACALKGAIGPQIVGGPGPTFFAMLNGASRIVLFSMVASRVGKFKACPWVFDPPLSWPILVCYVVEREFASHTSMAACKFIDDIFCSGPIPFNRLL